MSLKMVERYRASLLPRGELPPHDPARVRIINNTPPGTACVRCHQDNGRVFLVLDARAIGARLEPMHPACAMAWYGRLRGGRR